VKQSKAHIKNIILLLLSSILLSLSFSSFNISFLAWIGLIPFFISLRNKNLKQSFVLSYICGFLFFLFSMYWLFHVTVFGLLVLSLYQALYFGIFGSFVSLFTQTEHGKPITGAYLILPSAWCLLEYVRANLFGGIGWNLLAYSQYGQVPVIQIADITGVYGVSFLIVLVNLALFEGISILMNKKVKVGVKIKSCTLFNVLSVFILFVLCLLYGYKQITSFSLKDIKATKLKLSLVQGNISQMHKWDIKYKDYILSQYEKLTLEAARLDRPDIIIWPETSIPGYLNQDSKLMRYMVGLSNKTETPILAGTPMAGINETEDGVELNSAVLFSSGKILQRYDKLHLVMFGEFVPLGRYFPRIRELFPITGNFIPGNNYTIFQLPADSRQVKADFAVLICFEDIFPGLVRRFVKEGADFMVNITNDAWFGRSAAPYQHSANSVFRAVENRRPFARAANTGLTCFIDRAGKLSSLRGSVNAGTVIASRRRSNQKPKEIFVDGYLTDYVILPQDTTLTFYTKYGDIFILFCLIITGCFVIDYIRYRKYNN
jgi:apolipoprotein N-acyltransferase